MKKVFFILLLIMLLTGCESELIDSDTSNNLENSDNASIALVELDRIRQAPAFINSVIGYQWNDFYYPGANISIFSYGTSNVIGEFGATDAEEELEIIMEIGRKKTIDENLKSFSSVNYKKGWNYDSIDAVMLQSDYYITKKGGGTLFVTKDKSIKIEAYLLGSRYVEGFAFSSAGFFATGHNGFDFSDTLNGIVYFTEDDVFSYDEPTSIPMHQYVDYRMLLQLRYLIRNGAREVSLRGINIDGEELLFNLHGDTDLIALSEEFESNNIETLWFRAKGDYRVDYFKGIIFSNESGKTGNRYIEYRKGKSISN